MDVYYMLIYVCIYIYNNIDSYGKKSLPPSPEYSSTKKTFYKTTTN